eukprot:11855390-Karenia_brevis.AAC.1
MGQGKGKDPHVLQLERSAPTPTSEAFTTTMQYLATAKSDGISSDISNAFGQDLKTSREQKLCVALPQGMQEA